MTETTSLKQLQKTQSEHDEHHHHDIYTLPYLERMNHYILHFSKYVGRLSRDYSDEVQKERLEKTLVDCFIVSLASANTLNLDINESLEEMFGVEAEGLTEWAKQLDPSDEPMDLDESQEWLFERLAGPAGRMANAMESIDHLEGNDYRTTFEEDTIEIISNLLIVSNSLDSDLQSLLDERWEEMENETVL